MSPERAAGDASADPGVDDRELLRRWREQGDGSARAELVERHMALVRSLARRYAGRGEPLEDLEQVGAIGLLHAIDRYQPERRTALTTYATATILGEIKRHFRDRVWAVHVPRRLQDLSLRVGRAAEQLTARLGRAPTVAELAAAAEVAPEDVLEALETAHAFSAMPLPEPDSEPDARPSSLLGREESGYQRTEEREAVASAIARLPERERELLALRFAGGLTQSEIGARVGISQMHVSRLLRRALERVRREVEGET